MSPEYFPCLLVVFLLALDSSEAVDGTAVSDPCQYPGLVAVVAAHNSATLCVGYSPRPRSVVLPQVCFDAVREVHRNHDLHVYFGNGNQRVIIRQQDDIGEVISGLHRIRMRRPMKEGCYEPATIYNSETMQLNLSTCEVVGHGGNRRSARHYSASNLASSPLTRSTSEPCCHTIKNFLDPEVQNVNDFTPAFNCLAASGSTCSRGDVGAPVYCTTIPSGQKVITALGVGTPCQTGAMFLAYDLTDGDATFKFGNPS